MNKFMALVMAAGLMTAMVGNAYAATSIGEEHSFEFRAQCKDSSTYTDEQYAYPKRVDNSSIYVKHSAELSIAQMRSIGYIHI